MAETIVGSILNWLAPREAEAKITGGPDEMAMLEAAQRQNARQKGNYLADQQQRVIEAAKAHPETVTLERTPGLLSRVGATAGYYAPDKTILYDPSLPVRDFPNTLAHELVHFLSGQVAPGLSPGEPRGSEVAPAPRAEHALIERFLGTNYYRPEVYLRGYQPGAVPPVEHDMWRSWLGGAPGEWPGR